MEFRGIDKRGIPFSFFKKVTCKEGDKKVAELLKG